jgi:hypothetical protein
VPGTFESWYESGADQARAAADCELHPVDCDSGSLESAV